MRKMTVGLKMQLTVGWVPGNTQLYATCVTAVSVAMHPTKFLGLGPLHNDFFSRTHVHKPRFHVLYHTYIVNVTTNDVFLVCTYIVRHVGKAIPYDPTKYKSFGKDLFATFVCKHLYVMVARPFLICARAYNVQNTFVCTENFSDQQEH